LANRQGNISTGSNGIKTVGTRGSDRSNIDGLISGGWWFRVESGQPEQVVHDVTQPERLPTHPTQCVEVLGHVPCAAERQTYFGLNNAEGCPEFMGSVGSELELTTPCLLNGFCRLNADQQGSEEYGQEQHRTGHNLQGDQVGLDMVDFRQTLANNEPCAVNTP
jgi:hypothetical protein